MTHRGRRGEARHTPVIKPRGKPISFVDTMLLEGAFVELQLLESL